MKYLLISGEENSGKSFQCGEVERLLISKGFQIFSDSKIQNGEENKDYILVLEGKDKLRREVSILLNYVSDKPDIIQKFKEYKEQYSRVSVIITSVRNSGEIRSKLLSAVDIEERSIQEREDVRVVETKRIDKKKTDEIEEDKKKVKALIEGILSQEPSNLF